MIKFASYVEVILDIFERIVTLLPSFIMSVEDGRNVKQKGNKHPVGDSKQTGPWRGGRGAGRGTQRGASRAALATFIIFVALGAVFIIAKGFASLYLFSSISVAWLAIHKLLRNK